MYVYTVRHRKMGRKRCSINVVLDNCFSSELPICKKYMHFQMKVRVNYSSKQKCTNYTFLKMARIPLTLKRPKGIDSTPTL